MKAEYRNKIQKFEDGYYRVTEDVANPNVDRRKRYDFFATTETIKKGTEFEVTVQGIEVEAAGFIKTGIKVYTVGQNRLSVVENDKAAFLFDKLEPADSLTTKLAEANVTAFEVLQKLLDTGKVDKTTLQYAIQEVTEN